MDFKRPERCQRQRTGREGRRPKFYEISDNLDNSNGSTEPENNSEAPELPGCGPGGRGFESRRSPSLHLQMTIFCVSVDRPQGKRGEIRPAKRLDEPWVA